MTSLRDQLFADVSLPVDVTDQLWAAGAIPCQCLEEMLSDIAGCTTFSVTGPVAS